MRRMIAGCIFLITVICAACGETSDFGVGVHSGIGLMKYEEHTASFNSEAKLPMILIGASAEYSFGASKHFFTGITTDWAWGLEDEEDIAQTLSSGSVVNQTIDLSIFAQFYDGRVGYKNSFKNIHYRVYASGGWDGFHFERGSSEDFSLWRIGGGVSLTYDVGLFVLDGRAAYSYYFDGDVRNSGNGGVWFDTNGTCKDFGVGVSRSLTDKVKFYAGVSYTSIKLDESEKKEITLNSGQPGFIQFPESETQMFVGIVNLTYAF